MLGRVEALQGQDIARLHVGEVGPLVFPPFDLVDAREAVEDDLRPPRDEGIGVRRGAAACRCLAAACRCLAARRDLRSPHVEPLPRHLGGYEPPPDKLVEGEHVLIEVGLQLFRREPHVGRADRLVGVLGRLAVREDVRLGGHVGRAEGSTDELPRVRQRLARYAHGVGPHVRDEARCRALADLHALEEPLRDDHRPFRREAQPRGRLLLEGARLVRRIRRGEALLLLNGGDREGALFQGAPDFLGLFLRPDARLLAVYLFELRLYLLAACKGKLGLYRPVLLLYERLDLVFPLADELERNGLHPARRQAVLDPLPQ